MTWACEFSADAEEDLRGLPKAIQKRVARVIAQMAADPFQGNVKALQGEEWKGVFRRRIGDYRLLLSPTAPRSLWLSSRSLCGPAKHTGNRRRTLTARIKLR
jgi:mRNA-degrading endonuclease RelE of RelBE toxin-antitoxin system